MALHYFAYLYIAPGFIPHIHTQVNESDLCKIKTIGMDVTLKNESIIICQKLVKENVQLIELCGGFGPLWVSKINEAIDAKVPVASVMHGPETRQAMLDLLKPKAL